jgi:hypothetical protein
MQWRLLAYGGLYELLNQGTQHTLHKLDCCIVAATLAVVVVGCAAKVRQCVMVPSRGYNR